MVHISILIKNIQKKKQRIKIVFRFRKSFSKPVKGWNLVALESKISVEDSNTETIAILHERMVA